MPKLTDKQLLEIIDGIPKANQDDHRFITRGVIRRCLVDMQTVVDIILTDELTTRLERLCDEGFLERHPKNKCRVPLHYKYKRTEKAVS